MEIFKIVTLSLSGLLLTLVGLMRLLNPKQAYAKNSGIQLADDVNLLNEMRGVSAVQLMGGIITLLGTIIAPLTVVAFALASLIFLGFAVGRFFSIAVDGKPNNQIRQGIMFELVLGAASLFFLLTSLL